MPIVISVLLLLFLDQFSKYLIRANFSLGESNTIIDPLFSLTYVENKGAAFGFGAGNASIFVVIALIVTVSLLIYYKYTKKTRFLTLSLGLILGGAWGNLIDRVMKQSVTDMFDFHFWPVFNVADVGVCIGCVFLIWHIIREN